MLPNYPTPFNPQTTIPYHLPDGSGVKLSVYNMTGQRVRRLVDDGNKPAGHHQITWDGRDETGHLVGSGVYLYRLEAGSYVKTLRLVLVK